MVLIALRFHRVREEDFDLMPAILAHRGTHSETAPDKGNYWRAHFTDFLRRSEIGYHQSPVKCSICGIVKKSLLYSQLRYCHTILTQFRRDDNRTLSGRIQTTVIRVIIHGWRARFVDRADSQGSRLGSKAIRAMWTLRIRSHQSLRKATCDAAADLGDTSSLTHISFLYISNWSGFF